MSEKIASPLYRRRVRVVNWLETLPQEFQAEAIEALDELCTAAALQIEAAYRDGYMERRQSDRVEECREKIKGE